MTSFAESQGSPMAKLLKARSALVVRKPFFGALLMSLRFRIDTRHPTCYTDAVVLGMNPDFLGKMSLEETMTVLAHEAMHCALKHPFRLRGRDFASYQEACDHVVNLLLKEEGFQFPTMENAEAYCDPAFQNMSVDQVYPIVFARRGAQDEEEQGQQPEGRAGGSKQGGEGSEGDSDAEGEQSSGSGKPSDKPSSKSVPTANTMGEILEPGSQRGSGGSQVTEEEQEPEQEQPVGAGDESEGDEQDEQQGSGDDEQQADEPHADGNGDDEQQEPIEPDTAPLSEAEQRALEEDWGQRAAAAAIQAAGRGHGSKRLKRAIDESVVATTPFSEYLRLFLLRAQRPDAEDWCRPSRRSQAAGAYLPSTKSPGIGTLVIAIDTSGSISEQDLSRFVAEVERARDDLRPQRTMLMFADDAVQSERCFEAGDALDLAGMARGGGGTDFRPVFARVLEVQEVEGEQIDGVIYLTDLDGRFPEASDDIPPTLWVQSESYFARVLPFGERVRLR